MAKKDQTGSAKGSGKRKAVVNNAAEISSERVSRNNVPRLQTLYKTEIQDRLRTEFKFQNIMEVPGLSKITVNMGLGEAVSNPKIVDNAINDLALITGQKPIVTKAKKAIATFKLREGQKIGACVTLRRAMMYEFFDRLVSFALPRVRDFKGISPKGFDGRGNFNMGIREGIVFSEISYESLDKPRGMNISIATTAKTDEQGRALLKNLGMPFRN